MTRRKLTLRRERLTELTETELADVVGGTHVACVTHGFSCDACPIPTLPVNACATVGSGCNTGVNCAIVATTLCS